MLYKKQGFPEDGEITLCTVKKILPTTVFVTLDEYQNKEGIIHISEIAPGRIRTIRDYIKEEKKILCKVIRINKERGNIDLSLRRVTKSAQINKNQELKQEQKAEKVLEVFGHQVKKSLEQVYKDFGFKIVEEYGSLHSCFEEVMRNGEEALTSIGVDKTAAKKIAELVKIRMKPPEVKIARTLQARCKAGNGIEIIKESFKKALALAKVKKYAIEVFYDGAPKYRVAVKASDYKTAEKQIEEVAEVILSSLKKAGGEGELSQK